MLGRRIRRRGRSVSVAGLGGPPVHLLNHTSQLNDQSIQLASLGLQVHECIEPAIRVSLHCGEYVNYVWALLPPWSMVLLGEINGKVSGGCEALGEIMHGLLERNLGAS